MFFGAHPVAVGRKNTSFLERSTKIKIGDLDAATTIDRYFYMEDF
jgi:hypothetical protein